MTSRRRAGPGGLRPVPGHGSGPEPPLAIETAGLTKRYRRVTALGAATIAVPQGRICALIGPNGAGKTTLLRLLCGLAEPTSGTAAILGTQPGASPAFLAQAGFLAQEMPLYRRLSARDHIAIGAHLNAAWDAGAARGRLRELEIPLDRPAGKLSGGQRAQVALALALAKQPRVLLLDEPVAALDPLARRAFLATLMTAVADAAGSLTVVLSSHLITDLERVCDYLIVLSASRVQLCGDTDDLLAQHKLLTGPRKDTAALALAHTIVTQAATARQASLLVRLRGPLADPAWQAADVSMEELALGYLAAGASPGLGGGAGQERAGDGPAGAQLTGELR